MSSIRGLVNLRIAQAVLLHQMNMQEEERAGVAFDQGTNTNSDSMLQRLLDAPLIVRRDSYERFEEFTRQKPIRGPRVGRKPTKAMKKAAKKARRA